MTAQNLEAVEVTSAKGDKFTLAISITNKLPVSVTTMSDNANLGDVAIETTFSDYAAVNGIQLPRHYTTKMDKYVQADMQVAQNTLDADAGELAAPDNVKLAAAPPDVAPVTVDAQPIEEGVG